jgi:peptide/nickel transport system ATP-binding protein/oligopeptide transport system ATP-binding protein
MTLLSIRGLHTHFVTRDRDDRLRTARALNGVTLDLQRGRILGLVGESGAGKSLTVTSILGLLRPPARVVAGQALFEGRDLLAMAKPEIAGLRGGPIGFVVQSPKASLDPLARVGEQLIRIQLAHGERSRTAARQRAEAILAAVGIPDPARRMAAWPHEFSGGMAQRVVIALALVNEPRLLIADEPTTALDVTVQAQILDLLAAQVRERGIGAILVTHDLGVVAQYCDDVAVMFAGAVVEHGPSAAVFRDPLHPYTQALLAATPERMRVGNGARLGGPPPDLFELPEGCLYRLRCDRATALCLTPPPDGVRGGQRAACHYAESMENAPPVGAPGTAG